MNRLLTEKVRAEMLNFGMDLVGFGPVERWKNAPYLLSPQAILPEAKTVVVGAIHITDTWAELGGEPEPQDHSPGGWMDQNALLDRTAYRVVRLLNDHGQKAIAVASSNIWRYRAFEGIPSLFAPDLSHIHAATAAGLAEIGWNGLAITPEFGARCRFISIVTDAELMPTPMYNGPALCDMCGACIRCCPTAAMRKDLNSKEPHVVEIGGRTFKYLNKNIWRCAWAEHFDLDLNSATLKQDTHVDEKVILREIQTNGKRGHERGVCQKVCVPPHLRTRQGSFGRPDKMIAQHRINQRYPESMPTLRKMRDDIIARAVELGADLAAVAPLDLDSAAGKAARLDVPTVRTVLAFAFQLPSARATCELRDIAQHKMHHLLLRIARMVEDYGYCAASNTYNGESNWFHFRAQTAEIAAMTDLGKLENGVFITPEFGPNQIVGAITTDALLDRTARLPAAPTPDVPVKLTGKTLRRKLEALAEQNLVSAFGVAPVARFDTILRDLRANINEKELGESIRDCGMYAHGQWVSEIVREKQKLSGPNDYVNSARSVLVLGMHFPEDIIANAGLDMSKQIGCYGFHQYQTCNELRFAALELTTFLSRMGYRTYAIENLLGVGSLVDSPRGHLPDARCGVIEAAAAGLGEIGHNGALLTAEHGPHQRFITIITDAELPVDEVQKPLNICGSCQTCRSGCPMQALEPASFQLHIGDYVFDYPVIQRHRCDWSKRYSLCPSEGPALIGNNTNIPAPDGKITIEQLAAACEKKDPVMKARTCILESCLHRCPAGRSTAN